VARFGLRVALTAGMLVLYTPLPEEDTPAKLARLLR
jgi:hypothetical protein